MPTSHYLTPTFSSLTAYFTFFFHGILPLTGVFFQYPSFSHQNEVELLALAAQKELSDN